MRKMSNLPGVALVIALVIALFATGTGAALASTTAIRSPAAAGKVHSVVPMTTVTYYRNGHKYTVKVPTSSLGIVTASSGLTKGESCILDFLGPLSFGNIVAEANDGASFIHLLVSSFVGYIFPYSDCVSYLTHHKAVATRIKGSGDE